MAAASAQEVVPEFQHNICWSNERLDKGPLVALHATFHGAVWAMVALARLVSQSHTLPVTERLGPCCSLIK